MVENVLWVEKYRPKTLEEVALSPENRALIKQYLDKGEVPHLLFAGPPGIGKTTLAKVIILSLKPALLTLNASDERGIDTVRNKVSTFAKTHTIQPWKVVFLDEADGLTADAQQTLRNLMETYAANTRFILTCNRLDRVIAPLQSRCQLISLAEMSMQERAKVLARVLKAESQTARPQEILAWATAHTDLRKMLMGAQREILQKGFLDGPPQNTASGMSLYTLLLRKDYKSFVALTKDPDFQPHQGLKDLFWAIPDDHPQAFNLRYIFGKAVHEGGWTPDPIVHFLGTVAEAFGACG